MCLSLYPINRVLYISGGAGIPTSAVDQVEIGIVMRD